MFARRHDNAELTAVGVSLLGLSALLLACVGIVGLVAYSVAQRTREIGIRIALGASGARVLSGVLRHLATPVGGGLVLGTAAAAALSQLLRRELYGVSHLDPTAYATAVAIFVLDGRLRRVVASTTGASRRSGERVAGRVTRSATPNPAVGFTDPAPGVRRSLGRRWGPVGVPQPRERPVDAAELRSTHEAHPTRGRHGAERRS